MSDVWLIWGWGGEEMDLAEISPSCPQQLPCGEYTCLELQGMVEQMLTEAHQLASKLSHAAVVEQQLKSELASCEQDLLESEQQCTEAEAAWETKYLKLAQKEAAWEGKYLELEMRLNVLGSSLVDSKATTSPELERQMIEKLQASTKDRELMRMSLQHFEQRVEHLGCSQMGSQT